MHDRTLLGPGDVSHAVLSNMVADLLGHEHSAVRLLSSRATPVAYDVVSITTSARHWVSGLALTPAGETSYRIFVKQVRAWHRSPEFASVPDEVRELAAASVPWRTEPLVYRSDLGDRLPAGLSMPRALGVFDLDAESTAIWLEEVSHGDVVWDIARYERAAQLLGRLAASPAVARLADVGGFAWSVLQYVHGRLAHQVLPVLRRDDVWQHPLVAGAFSYELRERLRGVASRSIDLATELIGLPLATSHGDACPNNLLPAAMPDAFVLIDFGFWLPQPVGFDLGQLLVGDVQLGRRDPGDLAVRDEACLMAYVAGLAAEGLAVPTRTVRRAHALQLAIFSGLSAVPFELLDQPQTSALHRLAAARAAVATHSMDLLDATG